MNKQDVLDYASEEIRTHQKNNYFQRGYRTAMRRAYDRPWTYIVEANNFQEALKRASRSGLTSDEDIIRVEIVEVKR